jgi:hypothetical protein
LGDQLPPCHDPTSLLRLGASSPELFSSIFKVKKGREGYKYRAGIAGGEQASGT